MTLHDERQKIYKFISDNIGEIKPKVISGLSGLIREYSKKYNEVILNELKCAINKNKQRLEYENRRRLKNSRRFEVK